MCYEEDIYREQKRQNRIVEPTELDQSEHLHLSIHSFFKLAFQGNIQISSYPEVLCIEHLDT